MDQTQFLDKYRALQTPANSVLLTVLKLWLLDGKSDDDIADALGKDRSTAVRKIGNICKHFGTDEKGKKEQRQQLVLLFRTYCSDFEVHSSLYPDWVKPNSITTKSENIVAKVVSIIPIASTLFDLLGRDADRAELEKISKQHKIVLLKAAAGIGKSTLAQEFLRTYFTKVIEINMALSPDDNAPASERLPIILKEFGEDASNNFGLNLEILKRRLSDKSQPSVAFLIDNIEPALGSDLKFLEKLRDYEGLLQVLGDRDVCSFTLITSRRSMIVQRVKVHEYSLQGLDIKAWREYFHDCENGGTSEALEQMRDAYNGNAKAMDILHGAITDRFDRNIAAYWNRCKNALLADAELETLISVEMDWLRDNQPDAYKLLCRMGCYRYQDVKTVPFEGLICLLWDIPESRQVGVVDYLSKSSLIEVKEEYYLHPAVRESAKSRLLENDKDWKIANHKAAKFWDSLIKVIEKIDDALIAFEPYHHYHAIKEFTLMGETLNFARDNQWEQNEFLGYSLWRLGLIDLVIGSVKCCLNEIYDSTILVDLYNLLGDSYWIKGILNLAIECHEKSYQISTFAIQSNKGTNLLPFKRRKISSLINKGLCLLSKWEIDDAIKLFFAARKFCNSSPENLKISYLFVSSFCIAFASSHSNTWQKISYKYIEKSINSLNALANVYLDSWSRGYSLLFVAISYKSLKEIDLSHKFFLRTLDYAIESNYPQLRGLAITGLGELARMNKNNKEAIDFHHQSVEIFELIRSNNDLAEAYFQLGLTYQAMGEHDQAETYKAKALKLFEQMEAPKQIERVNQAFEQRSKQ